jgi:hypothetical protein
LLAHDNPVALIVLAHLKSRQTRDDPQERGRVKLGLILRLYEKKLEPEELRQWYRYLDWLLPLPAEEEAKLWQQISQFEQEKSMPFITFAERYGYEKGERAGLLKALESVLRLRFGAAGMEILADLQRVDDPSQLDRLRQEAEKVSSLDDFRKLLPKPGDAGNGAAS